LVTFPKRKVTRAAAAARNRGTWPSQRHSEILRDAQDDKSRRQPHGTGASLRSRAQEPSCTRHASTTARSFAMLGTRVGGSRMERRILPSPTQELSFTRDVAFTRVRCRVRAKAAQQRNECPCQAP
jgi:hypothetical protein